MYAFIFGRDKLLGFIELISWLKARSIDYSMINYAEDFSYCIIAVDDAVIDELTTWIAGTVKIVKITCFWHSIESINIEELTAVVNAVINDKINYGINIFVNASRKKREQIYSIIKQKFKQFFNANKCKARLVMPRLKHKLHYLQPKEIITKKLIESKTDFCFFISESVVYAGYTVKLINPEQFKQKDQARTAVSIEAMSPRLAKILINLAGLKQESFMLDPFCGIGTVLVEATLLGINVVGTDINENKINAARQNVKAITSKTVPVIKADATKLAEIQAGLMQNAKFDAIVTEPYLGPLLRHLPSYKQAKLFKQKLEKLYNAFLDQAAKLLKQKAKLVMIVPYFKTKGKKKRIVNINLKFEHFRIYNAIAEYKPDAIPITYNTKTKIGRLIYVLERC